jgi:hypothetical protein
MLFFNYGGFEFGLLNWPRYIFSPPMSYAYIVAVVVRSPSIVLLYVPAHFIPPVLYLVRVLISSDSLVSDVITTLLLFSKIARFDLLT